MDIKALPFDADAMLEGLRPMDRMREPDLGCCRRQPHDGSRFLRTRLHGRHHRADSGPDGARATAFVRRFPHPDAGEPGILILGHLDTVHPVGTLEKLPFRRDGDICYGPGICRHEGRELSHPRSHPPARPRRYRDEAAVTIMFTPRRGDRHAFRARSHRGGGFAGKSGARARAWSRTRAASPSGRYAIARFNIATIGRPSHAGARLSDGRSAIREMGAGGSSRSRR